MPYSTAAQVLTIVDTNLTDDAGEITGLIAESDAIMDLKLDTGSLPALVLQAISRLMTAYHIMLKDPNARKIGAAYSEDRAIQLKLIKDELDFYMSTAGGGISVVIGRDALA